MLRQVGGRKRNERTYSYDDEGRLSAETLTTGGTTYSYNYTYDPYSRLKDVTYPANPRQTGGLVVRHKYDAKGYLEKVQNTGGTLIYWQATARNADRLLTHFTLGNDNGNGGISTQEQWGQTRSICKQYLGTDLPTQRL